MVQNKIYIVLVTLLFAAFALVLNLFPRSAYSPLEKRELARFPEFSLDSLFSGAFTTSINSWYSDSEPFRDRFMQLSMKEKDLLRVVLGEENVTFHAAAGPVEEGEETDDLEMKERDVEEYHNNLTADEKAKIANKGIIIVGSGPNVRALMAYGGSSKGGVQYAEAANEYKRAFGSSVNVYCMVIPTAVDFYCPEKARRSSNPEQPTIRNIYSHLLPDVHAVDVYTALGKHAAEDIFLRTDHHWAPLGAFYAAEQFARVAGVPFKQLSSYERKVVHRFVGSMYGYSQDIALKNAPEDFVYYVPQGVDYSTTYTDYVINSNYEITAERKPYKGIFFYKYKDGSGGAYCTFMGGDTRITCVRTPQTNHRRVLILKDSFGRDDVTKNAEMLTFAQRVIALRKNHQVFRRRTFFGGSNNSSSLLQPDITWHDYDGKVPDWKKMNRFLGMRLGGSIDADGKMESDFYLAFNTDIHDKTLVIPPPSSGRKWYRAVDTSIDGENAALAADKEELLDLQEKYVLPANSVLVLLSR